MRGIQPHGSGARRKAAHSLIGNGWLRRMRGGANESFGSLVEPHRVHGRWPPTRRPTRHALPSRQRGICGKRRHLEMRDIVRSKEDSADTRQGRTNGRWQSNDAWAAASPVQPVAREDLQLCQGKPSPMIVAAMWCEFICS